MTASLGKHQRDQRVLSSLLLAFIISSEIVATSASGYFHEEDWFAVTPFMARTAPRRQPISLRSDFPEFSEGLDWHYNIHLGYASKTNASQCTQLLRTAIDYYEFHSAVNVRCRRYCHDVPTHLPEPLVQLADAEEIVHREHMLDQYVCYETCRQSILKERSDAVSEFVFKTLESKDIYFYLTNCYVWVILFFMIIF